VSFVSRVTRQLTAFLLVLSSSSLVAQQHLITPNDIETLQQRIDMAVAGDTLLFSKGVYPTHLVIKKTLHLKGQEGAVLDGGETGNVIHVYAPDVEIQGFTIQNSGKNLTDMNAGIFVEAKAARVFIHENFFRYNLFGIWLDSSHYAKIYNNQVEGTINIRSQDRGNGIHLFNVRHAEVFNNEVWHTRDGIYIDTSNQNKLHGNFLRDLRYGIHYMYSNNNEVINNHTKNTRTGYALMQSHHLTVMNNSSEADANYGILMNFITYSRLHNNHVTRTLQGRSPSGGEQAIIGAEGKALFVYNSVFNELKGNIFSHSDIGVHLTAGSENNKIYTNGFVNNVTQVKYVANNTQEWSLNEQGNYWSDYLGWDRDSNNIGDVAYEPNDAVDKLLWRYPSARLLMHSPAVKTLRWVQRQFPVLRPAGVKDSYPLMRLPQPIKQKEGTS